MTKFTALYDACVLYPPSMRDLLIQLAVDGLHRAKWSEKIHSEWIRNALINNPHLNIETLTKTKELINNAVLDCLVEDFHELEASLNLPDENDKHVLAAAIVSHSDVIVTYNLKDFPRGSLEKYGIEAQHPDIFLLHLLELNQHIVIKSIQAIYKKA
ncbi:Uncharacterised protein (plasmid) [Legionella adelaidensis]|uniref:Uncharacterized protein n=1 Tax=Legionella adelaidensis TaxID=45056 RepID=A0A0W0R1T8_9GAMM|nr:PIN domain-containing protein [Legionella adelaidensis]KTC65056.1 hypothetical protein Lade_1579 [Legionella adelaidensis]VEH85424.1 Uncharacterised protein [Legionella adelaidensis]